MNVGTLPEPSLSMTSENIEEQKRSPERAVQLANQPSIEKIREEMELVTSSVKIADADCAPRKRSLMSQSAFTPKIENVSDAHGNTLVRTSIDFYVSPDFLRSWFWFGFILMLVVGAVMTEFFSSEVDWEDNQIKSTFGTNNPCLWLDHAPATYVIPGLWVLTAHIFITYVQTRWARVKVCYEAERVSHLAYATFTASCFMEVFFLCWFSAVFAEKPDDDIKMHTLPYTFVAVGLTLNIISNTWYAKYVAAVPKWMFNFLGFYCVSVTTMSALKMFAEFACLYELDFGCYKISKNGALPINIQTTWIILVIPMELFLSLMKGDETGRLHVEISMDVDPKTLHRTDLSFWEILIDEPTFCWVLLTFLCACWFAVPVEDIMDCATVIDTSGFWANMRGFIYFTNLIILASCCLAYWNVACCCCRSCCPCCRSRDDPLNVGDFTQARTQIWLEPLDLDKLDSNENRKWLEDHSSQLRESEQYLIKPMFVTLFFIFAYATNARLSEKVNGTHGPSAMFLCFVGKIIFSVYVINWINILRKQEKKWHDPQMLVLYIFLGWLMFVTFIRTIAALTGDFTLNYLGRDPEC